MKKLITCLYIFCTLLLISNPGFHVRAGTSGTSYQLTAQVFFESQGKKKPADQSMLILSDQWKCVEDVYLYEHPVCVGDTVELMRGVRIPSDWGNEWQGQAFSIIIEAALTQKNSKEGFATAAAKPVILEYELSSDGKETAYVNNKTVIPGQVVSKIVRICVEGESTGQGNAEVPRDSPDTKTKKQDTTKVTSDTRAGSTSDVQDAKTGAAGSTGTVKAAVGTAKESAAGSRNTKTGESAFYLLLPMAAGAALLALLIWVLIYRKRRRDEKRGQADLPG